MPTADVSVHLVSEDPRCFRLSVHVREPDGETSHDVTLARDLLARLAPSDTAQVFARRCFAFLLEREPKESILRRFDLPVIGRYFPEFVREMTG